MNQKAKRLLMGVKEELETCLDLNIGSDDPKFILNYIHSHCKHPLYYVHGFYRNPNILKEEIEATKVTEETCDYCLLQCLECGDFLGIDKSYQRKNEWYQYLKKKPIFVIQTQDSYEKTRMSYFKQVLKSNKDEKNTAKQIRKTYCDSFQHPNIDK